MGLGGIYESLNTSCDTLLWRLDDMHIPIAGIFERLSLPPILFPIIILAIIALIIVLLLPVGEPTDAPVEPFCGDGMCLEGEEDSCPEDCGPDGVFSEPEEKKKLTVLINGNIESTIRVQACTIKGDVLEEQSGTSSAYEFYLSEGFVLVKVINPDGVSRSASTTMSEDDNELSIALPDDFFGETVQMGSIRILVVDSLSGNPTDAEVSLFKTTEMTSSVNTPPLNPSEGTYIYNVPAGAWYYPLVQKDCYSAYDGSSSPKKLQADQELLFEVVVESITPPNMPEGSYITTDCSEVVLPDGTHVDFDKAAEMRGTFTVCVTNTEGIPVTHGGLVTLYTADGSVITHGDLQESNGGCMNFDLLAGLYVYATVSSPPAGCTASSPSEVMEVPLDRVVIVPLQILCGDDAIAYAKVRVRGGSQILTDEVQVFIRDSHGNLVPGTGNSSSLTTGDGGFTEEITVPADTTLYAWAVNVPSEYTDSKSQAYKFSSGEHGEIELNLTTAGESDAETIPESLLQFTSISYPENLEVLEEFEVSILKVEYQGIELSSDDTEVKIDIGGELFNMSYGSNGWTAVCTAPEASGEHEFAIVVNYGDKTHSSDPYTFRVYEVSPNDPRLKIRQLLQTDKEPPVTLNYKVLYENGELTSISSSSISAEYVGTEKFETELPALSFEEDSFVTEAAVPFKGEYKNRVTVTVSKNNTEIERTLAHTFTSASTYSLDYDSFFEHRVMRPSTAFRVAAQVFFRTEPIDYLTTLKLLMYDKDYSMSWDRNEKYYMLTMSAPEKEGIYEARFAINDQEPSEPETIYIIDPNKEGTFCPLQADERCDSRPQVRACAKEYFSGTAYYTEDDMIKCIEDGWGSPPVGSFECSGFKKGDLNGDCMLTEKDIALANTYLATMTEEEERNLFSDCADLDLDGDVDEDDIDCMYNVVSGRWYGETGGDCESLMRGAFCFDIDTTSQIYGDVSSSSGGSDGMINRYDLEVFDKILELYAKGLQPTQELLDFLDFNLDNRLDANDRACLEAFAGVDISSGSYTYAEDSIPLSCLKIYRLKCSEASGDVNDDGVVDNLDLLLFSLIMSGDISLGIDDLECLDINEDGTFTEEDLLCVTNLVNGNEAAFLQCISCIESIPRAAYGQEICDDGIDNDCDGLVDRTSTDWREDECICGEHTSCDRKWDADGGSKPGVADGNYLVCRDVSWNLGLGYSLHHINTLECNEGRNCDTIKCENITYTCSCCPEKWYSDQIPVWFSQCVDIVPIEEEEEVEEAPNRFESVTSSSSSSSMYPLSYSQYAGLPTCDGSATIPAVTSNVHMATTAGQSYGPPEGYEYVIEQVPHFLPMEMCDDGWDNDCSMGDAPCEDDDDDSCFPAGTKILLADGTELPIEDINVGDMVMSFDFISGESIAARVLEIESPLRSHLYTLSFLDGSEIRVTDEHPFFVIGKGWAAINPEETLEETGHVVAEIKPRDIFLTKNGAVKLTDISYEYFPEGVQTYNLKTIEGTQNFFADGFLVHNKGCLSLYSLGSEGYRLDGIAYAFAVTPEMEMDSYVVLDAIESGSEEITIKMIEEFPEITSINYLKLIEVFHDPSARIIPSASGELFSISEPVAPLTCSSEDGDCLSQVSSLDNDKYRLDLSSHDMGNPELFEDMILTFPKELGVSEGKLVIDSAESGVISYGWWRILEIAGPSGTEELFSLAESPEDIAFIMDWINRRGAISISVDGVLIDQQYPPSGGFVNEMADPIIIPLELNPSATTVEVNLSFLLAGFDIDRVFVDYSSDGGISSRSIPIESAISLSGEDVTEILATDDSDYYTTNQSGGVVASFSVPGGVPEDYEATYIIDAKGYYGYDIDYNEWESDPESLISIFYDDAFFKELVIAGFLRDSESFLKEEYAPIASSEMWEIWSD